MMPCGVARIDVFFGTKCQIGQPIIGAKADFSLWELKKTVH
jgi:hypothetical protein